MKFKSAIPAIPVHNIKKAVNFYESKFDFKSLYKDKSTAIMHRDDVSLHLWVVGDKMWRLKRLLPLYKPVATGMESYLAGSYTCRFEVENLDQLYDTMLQRNVLADEQTVIEDSDWNTREFATKDLHGNMLIFYEKF